MSKPKYPTMADINGIFGIFRTGWKDASADIINAFGKGASKKAQSYALSTYVKRRFSRGFDPKLVRRVMIYAANHGYVECTINAGGYKMFRLTDKGRSATVIAYSHPSLDDFKLDIRPYIVVEESTDVVLTMPKLRVPSKSCYRCPGPELAACDQRCSTCLLESSNFHDVLPTATITKTVTSTKKLYIPEIPEVAGSSDSICNLLGLDCQCDHKCLECAFNYTYSGAAIRALVEGNVRRV